METLKIPYISGEDDDIVELTPITLAFKRASQCKSKIGKLISYWTKSDYFHVEIIFNGYWISATPNSGVYIRKLQPLDKAKYVYVTLEPKKRTVKDINNIIKFINSVDGSTYNIMGIIYNQILGLNIYTDKYFCSELATEILESIGYTETLRYTPCQLSPKDLYDIFGNNELYITPRAHSIWYRFKYYLQYIFWRI